MKRKYPPDTREFTTMNYFGNTLYHAYNSLSEEDRLGLLEEIEDEIKTNSSGGYNIVEATSTLPTRKIKNKKCWYNFFKVVKKHLYEYAKITNNPKIKTLKVAEYWAKRMGPDISDEDYHNEMYIYYGNSHSHNNLDLGIIYYLQNPSRIYGTIMEQDGVEFIVPGDQNSLIIHHPDINHEAVLPHPSFLDGTCRCVLIVDFKYSKYT